MGFKGSFNRIILRMKKYYKRLLSVICCVLCIMAVKPATTILAGSTNNSILKKCTRKNTTICMIGFSKNTDSKPFQYPQDGLNHEMGNNQQII